MANMGNAVTAILKLDASNFNNGVNKAVSAIEKLQAASKSTKSFSTLANSLAKFSSELTKLDSASTVSSKALTTLSSNITRVGNALSVVKKFETEVQIFKQMASSVKQFNSALNSLVASQTNTTSSTNTLSNSMRSLASSLLSARTNTTGLASTLSSISSASSIASSSVNSTSNSFRNLANSNASLVSSVNSSKSSLSTLNTSIGSTSTQLNQLQSKATSTGNSVKSLGSTASTSASNVSKMGSSASTATSGFNSLNSSVAKSSQTAKAADGRYKTLSNTLFSLRGITSMVGAMFAFNLVQGFIDSTQQSINAKSQMEAYQKTLGLSENAISSFNKKLNETVSIYKKMNKYSLGETVAGLGIEFDLSEKQMEGMMKTVARLQSEYLRAGRSAEEADLAVKDIMQGEFLRLSRETGVGKTDLQALGWSGDTKDIESLQRALDKVAEQRNWDAFATQATSLSDVLQILKNRFGEFVADLTSFVTPAIVGAFNTISEVFTGISNWYKNSSFFTQGMTQVLGFATALGVLTTALIAYKGHMGLAEIAQAGFLRSLLGVTLGFDKTAIASNTASTMLKAWIAGTDTATASGMKFSGALASKILGLNRASVATNGVTTTLVAMARGYDIAENGMLKFAKGTQQFAEAEKALNTIMSSTGVHIDLNSEKISKYASTMETSGIKSLSFAQKLAVLNKEVSVAEASTMSTGQALKAFAGSATAAGLAVSAVLIVALVAVAAAFASVYDSCQRAKEAVDGFNDVVENGDDYIKDAKNRASYWEGVKRSADQHRQNATSATESANAEKYYAHAKNMARDANNDYQASLEAVQKARSYDAQHSARQTQLETEHNSRLQEAYRKTGLSAEEAAYKANNLAQDVEDGNDVINRSLDNYEKRLDSLDTSMSNHADRMRSMGADGDAIQSYLDNQSREIYKVAEAWKAFDQGDMWAGAKAMVGELKLMWNDLSSYFNSGLSIGESLDLIGTDVVNRLGSVYNQIMDWFNSIDWYELGGNVSDGLVHALNSLADYVGNIDFGDVAKRIGDWFNSVDWEQVILGTGEFIVKFGLALAKLGVELFLAFTEFLDGVANGLLEAVGNWWDSSVVKPLSDAWSNFMSDPLGSIGGAVTDFGSWLLDTIFGEGTADAVGKAWEWFNNTVILPLQQAWSNFISDPIGYFTGGIAFGLGMLLDALFGEGTSDAFGEMWNWLNTSIIMPLQQAWANFTSDPLGYLMSGVEFGIGMLLDALLGNGETDGFTAIWNWFNNSFILPLQQAWSQFTSDPLGYLMGVVLDLNSLLSKLIGDDPVASVWNFVNTNIIQPFSQAIQNGLANIPILGSILQMLGLIDGANGTSSQKGKTLGDMFKQAIEQVIGSIPIVGDILRMLGLIDTTTGTANQKGQNVGKNIKDGEKTGHTGTSSNVSAEMNDVVNAVANAVGQAYSAAVKVGQSIWNGINSILQRASPGFIHDQVKAEFQTDLPSAISGATDAVYSNAQLVGQAMVDGVTPSVDAVQSQLDTAMSQAYTMPQIDPATMQMLQVDGMDAMANQDALAQYESDAMFAEQLNTNTALNTQATFTGLGSMVDSTFQGMGTSMVTAYTGMNTNQTTLLSTMQNQNRTAYTNMQTQTQTSLNNMRNQTNTVTTQMVGAWNTMKNNIVSAANQLKSESTSHFNQLSNTIGTFYRKLQNPSSWGAGDPNSTKRYSNHGRYKRGVKAVTSAFGNGSAGGKGGSRLQSSFGYRGAGSSSLVSSSTMTVKELLKMMCPNGDCLSGNQKVDVEAFLSSFTEGGFGNWKDWHPTHFNHIKTTSNEWDMKSPQIMGWIDTNTNFKVKDFLNGQPQITFDEFRSMAEALFSAIPYDFYYNSDKCGNWVAALESGSVNCYDGASALIALAGTCGFSGTMAHGTWNGIPHVWAVINGQKMDTTGWQQRRSWTPSASAGAPPRNMDVGNTTNNSYNVSVVIEGDVYGVEDLEEKIDVGVQKGMAEAMNTSNIIGV